MGKQENSVAEVWKANGHNKQDRVCICVRAYMLHDACSDRVWSFRGLLQQNRYSKFWILVDRHLLAFGHGERPLGRNEVIYVSIYIYIDTYIQLQAKSAAKV